MGLWLKSKNDAITARIEADARARLSSELAVVEATVALAKLLQSERKRFHAHGLRVAIDATWRNPGIYITKTGSVRFCHIWWCYNAFRLETTRTSRRGNSVVDRYDDLTADVDVAARIVFAKLDEGRLWLGTGYLPHRIIYLDDVQLHALDALALPASAGGQSTQLRRRPTNDVAVAAPAKRRFWRW